MPESLRPEPRDPPQAAGVDHDAKIEDLLLTGLDHYFAGAYERAIHVWTRALFLDRGHARARAYIERARAALAEQQRESEELLQRGMAAFDRGEMSVARRLLTSSVERGGPQELALPILARLNRLEAAVRVGSTAGRAPAPRIARGPAVPPARPRRRSAATWLGLPLLLLAVGAGWVRVNGGPPLGLAPEETQVVVPPAPPSIEPLPLVRPGAIALARATRLFETGRPADALRTLALVRASDPLRPEADRLRAEIQRQLLAPFTQEAGVPGR
jgi:hypothetical protein